MTTRGEGGDPAMNEEELSARRSNRRTLLVILTFILVLGLLPLALVLINKLS